MPFIDTEKLHRLNIAFNNNEKSDRKIDIYLLYILNIMLYNSIEY